MGLAERLAPVRDAAIAYGQRRNEVGLLALRRAVNAALEDVDDVPDDGDPTWPEVVAKIAAANAGAACAKQVAAELRPRKPQRSRKRASRRTASTPLPPSGIAPPLFD